MSDSWIIVRMNDVAAKRAAILSPVPEKDRAIVGLESNRILNTSPGWRPSDALAEAVRRYQAGELRNTDTHFAGDGAGNALCGKSIRYTNDPAGREWWLATSTNPREITCCNCRECIS